MANGPARSSLRLGRTCPAPGSARVLQRSQLPISAHRAPSARRAAGDCSWSRPAAAATTSACSVPPRRAGPRDCRARRSGRPPSRRSRRRSSPSTSGARSRAWWASDRAEWLPSVALDSGGGPSGTRKIAGGKNLTGNQRVSGSDIECRERPPEFGAISSAGIGLHNRMVWRRILIEAETAARRAVRRRSRTRARRPARAAARRRS